MSSRKTSVEINAELPEAVRRILETRTVKETFEEASHEVVRAEARRQEVKALSSLDGMDLADPEIMARAWRVRLTIWSTEALGDVPKPVRPGSQP